METIRAKDFQTFICLYSFIYFILYVEAYCSSMHVLYNGKEIVNMICPFQAAG
jgi:hypothetical protein